MTTKIFNPAQFAPPDQLDDNNHSDPVPVDKKNYALSGNSTRDQVRKLLYEIFSGDDADTTKIAKVIEALENQISKNCPNPSSKQYRDSSRALQTKLKGSRFTELRLSIVNGDISVQDVCSEEYLSGKMTLAAK